MYAMFGILFVLALGLKDELLEDIVIPCDDTADSTHIRRSKMISDVLGDKGEEAITHCEW
jgi:hypothetical protein